MQLPDLPQELLDDILLYVVLSSEVESWPADKIIDDKKTQIAGLPLVCPAFHKAMEEITLRLKTAHIDLDHVHRNSVTPRITNPTLATCRWFIRDGKALEAGFTFTYGRHARKTLGHLAGVAKRCKSLEKVELAVGVPKQGPGTHRSSVNDVRKFEGEIVSVWAQNGVQAVQLEVVIEEMDGRLHWA